MSEILTKFYKSKAWQKLVDGLKVERANADGFVICEHCGKPILRKYDCIGHHKVELTEENVTDAEISLNPDNIALIHFKCHNEIHDRFQSYTRKVYLVYGSPCSGKTSYVDEVANGDDLILDVDRLWDALCNGGRYKKTVGKSKRPGRVKQNVFAVRDCLLDQIRTRAGMWRNAWVIGGYPLKTDRDRLCDMLGAEPIYCEATLEECLERCERERPEEWKGYIREWFEVHTE